LALPRLVWLILHLHPVGAVVVKDLAPGIEQIDDSVLDAPQAFIALSFIGKWLFSNPVQEHLHKFLFKVHSDFRDLFNSPRGREIRFGVTSQGDQGTGKAAV
jgi:hypothetical protein